MISVSEQLTIHEAAHRLGLTARRLHQLVAARRDVPCVGRGKHRRFLWPDLRAWRDRELVRQGRQSVGPRSPDLGAREVASRSSVSQIELAGLLGVAPHSLYTFRARGIPTVRAGTSGRGVRYAWPESLHWFIRYRANVLRRTVGAPDGAPDGYVIVPRELWAALAHAPVIQIDGAALQRLTVERDG